MNYTECQLSFILSNWAEGSTKKCGNKKARKSRMAIIMLQHVVRNFTLYIQYMDSLGDIKSPN